MPKTYYLSNALINHALRAASGAAFARPSSIYLGLFTTSPSRSGGGLEIVGGLYSRQLVAFTAPNNGASTNTADVAFPTATAPWGVATHFGIFDSLSGGNLLYFAPLADAKTAILGTTIIFQAGQLALVET